MALVFYCSASVALDMLRGPILGESMLRSFTTDVPFRGLHTSPFQGADAALLGKRTVVYGRNGAGKTSFSELLRLAHEPGGAEGSIISASLRQGEATKKKPLPVDDAELRVLVYNRFFVEDSLRLFLDGGVSEPIVKLGRISVDVAEELARLEDRVKRLGVRRDAIATTRFKIEAEKNLAESETKSGIIELLGVGAASAKYNKTAFRVDHARARLAEKAAPALNADQLEEETEIAVSEALVSVARLSEAPTWDGSLWTGCEDVLRRSVLSNTIPGLREEAAESQWVEDGLALHSAGETCKFCRTGLVSEEVLNRYREHFSSSLNELRQDIAQQSDKFQALIDSVRDWEEALPDSEALLAGKRKTYVQTKAELASRVTAFTEEAERAIALLAQRLADPLEALSEEKSKLAAPSPLDASDLQEILDSNNVDVGEQEARKQHARTRIEGHVASLFRKNYAVAMQRLVLASRASAAVERGLKALDARHLALKQSQEDTGLMASMVDEDLRQHFGHDHLRVLVSKDRTGYTITRNGTTATKLSEGERNAIAFCYFLRSLEADGIEPASTLVVVDDPVTSLDKEALFAAFALAEERTKAFAQTIFLTHDYEYFRLQLNQRKNNIRDSNRLQGDGNASEIAYPRVSVLEIYAARIGDTRVSRLRPLSKELLNHPSEYHYLFSKVAGAVLANGSGELPLLGNAARRMFEGFISFRAPQGLDFQAKVTSVSAASKIDPTLSNRVVKFLHGHSHREDPTPLTSIDFPSIELELQSVLNYMREADSLHFSNMCKAVGVAEADLEHIVSSV